MRFRFLHIADVHLGYRQYGKIERSDDFARAFKYAVDQAIEQRVDFVVLAGDLFHKRAIDALTLNQAYFILDRLKQAGIPCLAVEGNHEVAYYDDAVGWLHFLGLRGMVTLLRPEFREGVAFLSPYAKRQGSYLDVLPGVRVHGLRYMGAGTPQAVERYADALQALEASGANEGVDYSIFMAHTGVEGVLPGDVGSPSLNQWGVLRPYADYVALGHIHKPFEYEGWLHNPGSLESCSVEEADWESRGYLLVDVDTDRPRAERNQVTRVPVPRRPIVRLTVKVEEHTSHDALCEHCCTQAKRRITDMNGARFHKLGPIVEVALTGVLNFESYELRLREIEERVQEATGALCVLPRNVTLSRDVKAVDRDGLSRTELERQVMATLFDRDAKYRPLSERWAKAAASLKELALVNTPAPALLEELEALIERVHAPDPDPESEPVF